MSIKPRIRKTVFMLHFSLLANATVLADPSYAAQVAAPASWVQASESGLRDGLSVMPLAAQRAEALTKAAIRCASTDSIASRHELRAQAADFLSSECVNDAFLALFGAILLVMLFDIRARMRSNDADTRAERASVSLRSTANGEGDSSQACE